MRAETCITWLVKQDAAEQPSQAAMLAKHEPAQVAMNMMRELEHGRSKRVRRNGRRTVG